MQDAYDTKKPSKLIRSLETKRLTGNLTPGELRILKDAYRRREEVERVAPNQNKTEPEQGSEPVIIPYVSPEEAERIIAGLDKQFQEKVMGKIKSKQEEQGGLPAEAEASGGGRGLQDYLTAVKAELPRVPFQDEDSHIDLSKLGNTKT